MNYVDFKNKKTIEKKDNWLKTAKAKYDTKTKDEIPKAKKIDMSDLITGYLDLPKSMHIIGQPGETSVRDAKKNENTIKGSEKASKDFTEPNKEYSKRMRGY